MKTAMGSLFLLVLTAIAGCAAIDSARHEYLMRGQVVDVADSGVYLCIGSQDGAQVSNEFKVYRVNREYVNPSKEYNPITSRPFPRTFKKEQTGIVKITEIVDEHFAKADVVTGKAELNSIVELNKTP